MPEPTVAEEIKRYLRTGDADIDARAWPGEIFDRGKRQHADLRDALVREPVKDRPFDRELAGLDHLY
ncbi:MAG: hypothetical protein ACREBE_19765 [bacterium]